MQEGIKCRARYSDHKRCDMCTIAHKCKEQRQGKRNVHAQVRSTTYAKAGSYLS
jgi:hypothetical protein